MESQDENRPDEQRHVIRTVEPGIVTIVQGGQPPIGSGTARVTDEEFEVLGEARQVFRLQGDPERAPPHRRHRHVEKLQVSPEEKRGKDGDLNRVSILSYRIKMSCTHGHAAPPPAPNRHGV